MTRSYELTIWEAELSACQDFPLGHGKLKSGMSHLRRHQSCSLSSTLCQKTNMRFFGGISKTMPFKIPSPQVQPTRGSKAWIDTLKPWPFRFNHTSTSSLQWRTMV